MMMKGGDYHRVASGDTQELDREHIKSKISGWRRLLSVQSAAMQTITLLNIILFSISSLLLFLSWNPDHGPSSLLKQLIPHSTSKVILQSGLNLI